MPRFASHLQLVPGLRPQRWPGSEASVPFPAGVAVTQESVTSRPSRISGLFRCLSTLEVLMRKGRVLPQGGRDRGKRVLGSPS